MDFISTCDCLSSDTSTVTLEPDSRSSVVFSFDPAAENGKVSKFMIIRTTQPGLPKALFEVTGTVTGNGGESREYAPLLAPKSVLAPVAGVQKGNKVIRIAYYYSAGCISCREFLEKRIPALEKKLKVFIEIDKRDIMDSKAYEEYLSILTKEETEKIAFPSLLIGNKLLQGGRQIDGNLEQELAGYTESDNGNRYKNSTGVSVSLALVPVLLAGFLDGINPCVFSTLLFLISSLTLGGRKRKEILIIGIFFTAAVFGTYYLIGLGIFQGLRTAALFPLMADIIKWILIIFLILVAALSLYDFFQIKRGRTGKISLQLPKFLKLKIHGIIRGQSRSTALITGSLLLGVMVSVFELACTGQVYFPTIAYMVNIGQKSAYFYLLVYNISFIIPLFFVFVLIYKGTGSKVITRFFQSNMKIMKISLSMLFFVLAGVVFWM